MTPSSPPPADRRIRRLAVVGGGWAGLAAAVRATELGWQVEVYETTRQWGGRARALSGQTADAAAGMPALVNGQHILIGGYGATLGLMQQLGVDIESALLQIPLDLRYADGSGLAVPAWAARWPPPLDLLAAILGARGWGWRDRFALLQTSWRWRAAGFSCSADLSVAELCAGLPPRVIDELVEPLCLSALNTPLAQASAAVLLRVLQDALFGAGFGRWRGADLLLPRVDLGELLPGPALRWLANREAVLHAGRRVVALEHRPAGWRIEEQDYDAVLLACPPREAARLVRSAGVDEVNDPGGLGGGLTAAASGRWIAQAEALAHEAIATCYAQARKADGSPGGLPDGAAMVALRSSPEAPAQFAFDRGQLGGPAGLLAFVVSASQGERADIERQVLAQAREQLGLASLQPLRTVVEKRATFACTPGLHRPAAAIAPRLWAAGDYVAGPYPATLEGAVRSGQQAAEGLQAGYGLSQLARHR